MIMMIVVLRLLSSGSHFEYPRESVLFLMKLSPKISIQMMALKGGGVVLMLSV